MALLSALPLEMGTLPIGSVLLAGVLISLALVVVYRLTLHPLASFPGPKLAAVTGLYETYYEVFKDGGGRYWVEIEEMHRKYGKKRFSYSSIPVFTKHASTQGTSTTLPLWDND
jgi:hypothetical protein